MIEFLQDFFINWLIFVSDSVGFVRDESTNLQHISEREPDDQEDDPSTHPTKGPIFMERSKSEFKIRGMNKFHFILFLFLSDQNSGCFPPVQKIFK